MTHRAMEEVYFISRYCTVVVIVTLNAFFFCCIFSEQDPIRS